jgi:intein-encoded DNA endonuclease-like protein
MQNIEHMLMFTNNKCTSNLNQLKKFQKKSKNECLEIHNSLIENYFMQFFIKETYLII